MTDKTLFDLDAAGRWRLAYDSNQWIIQKRGGTRRKDATGRDRQGKDVWQSIRFIGGPKKGLWRSFRELEIMLTDDAIAWVDALSDDFLTWQAQERQKEAGVPAEGGAQRDHGPEGAQVPEKEMTRPSDSPAREEAA